MPDIPERPRRIRVQRDGPLLVEGPVEVVGDDGEVAVSNRFTVAVCTCRRSRTPPWCDTSHRRREKRHDAHGSGCGRDEVADEGADDRANEEGNAV